MLVYMKVRKQKLFSIGFKTDNIIKSIILGILFSVPIIAPTVIYAISNSVKVVSINELLWKFIFYFFEIALLEEVICRGFMQTRIQGLVKSKRISIIIVALMFTALHIPFRMMQANMSLLEYVKSDINFLMLIGFFHIYMVYLYTRNNNILSVVIAHGLVNFAQSIFIIN